jgi:hypothetical protein
VLKGDSNQPMRTIFSALFAETLIVETLIVETIKTAINNDIKRTKKRHLFKRFLVFIKLFPFAF